MLKFVMIGMIFGNSSIGLILLEDALKVVLLTELTTTATMSHQIVDGQHRFNNLSINRLHTFLNIMVRRNLLLNGR